MSSSCDKEKKDEQVLKLEPIQIPQATLTVLIGRGFQLQIQGDRLIGGPSSETKQSESEDVPVDGPIAPQQQNKSCIKCSQEIEITGDLADRFNTDKTKEFPPCDDVWRSKIGFIVKWNNEWKNEESGEHYEVKDKEASVAARFEVLDELSSFITHVIGTIINLPTLITNNGITSIDDIIRDFESRAYALIDGKLDMDQLFGEVYWEFSLRERSNVLISHAQGWEAFVKDNGIYDFEAKVLVDLIEQNDLQLQQKDKDLGYFKKESFLAPESAQPDDKDYFIVTKEKGSSNATPKEMTLSAGLHFFQVQYKLKAGFGGIANEEVKRAIKDAIVSAKAALNAINRAISDLIGVIGGAQSTGNAFESAQTALSSSIDAGKDALSALAALIGNLTDDSRAYVRLYTTLVTFECR